MTIRFSSLLLFICCCALFAHATELHTQVFVKTPAPARDELLAPRALAVDASTRLCYVLDSGLRRVVSFNFDGQAVGAWPLEALGTQMPADPLLPQPALAVAKKSAYLLLVNRVQHQLEVRVIDGPGAGRTLTMPDDATNGAVALDNTDRVLVAYLRLSGAHLELVLAREGDDGAVATVTVMKDPCDTQVGNMALTGFAAMPDGRVAVGIAQTGVPAYGFVRSWLVQATLQGTTVKKACQTTHRFALLDQRGKILERFRMMAEMAGRAGYPAKPCVPLFTSLAFGPDDTIISGGHTLDPFWRVYDNTGHLLRSIARRGCGGQQVAAAPAEGRLFTLDMGGHVLDLSPDGRVLAAFGRPLAYSLAHPLALAADSQHVYVVVRMEEAYRLLRFTATGQFRWALALTPPAGLEKAQPLVTMLPNDRAVIGWRLPEHAGVSWAETVQEDSLPGLPLWRDRPAQTTTLTTDICPTPLLMGENKRLYVLRETAGGVRLQALSPGGVLLQQFPPEVQGVTAVAQDGSLSWAHQAPQGMIISRITPLGEQRGWKLVPRSAENAQLMPAVAHHLWGWLTSTHSLLQLNDAATVVDEAHVFTPEGDPLEHVAAICGDQTRRIYLAAPGRILVVEDAE